MNRVDIKKLGFTDRFLARVFSQYKDMYRLVCENSEMIAEISGKFRFETTTLSDLPAIGDFVVLDRNAGVNGNAIIYHVF